MDLDGKKALVTGGSEGIGRAIAAALVAEGCDVTITGRRRAPLEAAAREVGAGWIAGDVGREEDAARTVREFVARHGRIDILVNNAGFGAFAPLVDTALGRMEEVFRTNVFGAFLMAREAARHFVAQGSGNLVNISSTAGLRGFPGGTAYASSKFALRGMTECWREELRRHGVRVLLVNPSEVVTGFAGKSGRAQDPSPRKLRPKEVADAVVGALRLDDRGFVPELSVWATNPFE
jgi:3-oxoacyl-[acyl-carrier protein] reductase